MMTLDQATRQIEGLHWLAYLLTGNREESIEMAMEAFDSDDDEKPYFSSWMEAWARRILIAKALAAIGRELAVSRERIKSGRTGRPVPPGRNWSLDAEAGKVEIEEALLAIEAFPRAALVLTVFEGVAVDDAAVLLDGTPEEVRRARAIGAQQLTANLAFPYAGDCRESGALFRQWNAHPASAGQWRGVAGCQPGGRTAWG